MAAVEGVRLRAGEVHVWHGTLDLPPGASDRLTALLSADEQARAARFHHARDRDRYISGRAQLRLLLGRYLGADPRMLQFTYGRYDKPHLAGDSLWFNLSHSRSVVLYAITTAGEVGIDVEVADADVAHGRVAEHFFSPAEVAALRSLRPERRAHAFLTCWTRKEAFIKARGDGLSLALDSFDVSLEPGQPPAIVRTAWSVSEPTEWSLSDLSDAEAGYVAALAVRGAPRLAITRRALPRIDTQLHIEQETG